MRVKFGRHHRDTLGVGLQGLVQGLVHLYGLSGSVRPALIHGPTQTVNIVVFTVFGLGRRAITQEALFVLATSTPKVRLGATHTTADICRVTGHALGR